MSDHDTSEVLRILGVKDPTKVTLVSQPDKTIPWAATYSNKRVAVIQSTYDSLVLQGAKTR